MDENFIFIMCVLASIAVFFIYFIYCKRTDSTEATDATEGLENKHIEKHMETDHQVECDGDKCFVKHRQVNRCDGKKCI